MPGPPPGTRAPPTRTCWSPGKPRPLELPASEDYARNVLRAAGVTPRLLRCTRLAEMTNGTDPKLVSAAFGIHPQAATHYLADHIDPGRMATESNRR